MACGLAQNFLWNSSRKEAHEEYPRLVAFTPHAVACLGLLAQPQTLNPKPEALDPKPKTHFGPPAAPSRGAGVPQQHFLASGSSTIKCKCARGLTKRSKLWFGQLGLAPFPSCSYLGDAGSRVIGYRKSRCHMTALKRTPRPTAKPRALHDPRAVQDVCLGHVNAVFEPVFLFGTHTASAKMPLSGDLSQFFQQV